MSHTIWMKLRTGGVCDTHCPLLLLTRGARTSVKQRNTWMWEKSDMKRKQSAPCHVTTRFRVWIIDRIPHIDRVRSRGNSPSVSTCQCIHLLHVNTDDSFPYSGVTLSLLIWQTCVGPCSLRAGSMTISHIDDFLEKCICPICVSRRRVIIRD